ncbi:phage GP46 family protein [Pantoea agglomerans]
MADIRTVWFADSGFAGWQLSGGDLDKGNDLESAVLISLFSDRRADTDDATDDNDRRGWWGDSDEELLGSRLWLLNRSPLSVAVARRAEVYAQESLAWLVGDGVMSSVSAVGTIVRPDRLYLTVTLNRPDGSSHQYKFNWLWRDNNAVSATYTQ